MSSFPGGSSLLSNYVYKHTEKIFWIFHAIIITLTKSIIYAAIVNNLQKTIFCPADEIKKYSFAGYPDYGFWTLIFIIGLSNFST